MLAIASMFHFPRLTEGRSARDLPKQLPIKKKSAFAGDRFCVGVAFVVLLCFLLLLFVCFQVGPVS